MIQNSKKFQKEKKRQKYNFNNMKDLKKKRK